MEKISKYKKDKSELAKRIEFLMEQRGFRTIVELEKKAGVKKDTVRRILGGFAKSARAESLTMIADALGVTTSEIVGTLNQSLDMMPVNIAKGAVSPRWVEITSDEMIPTFKVGEFVLADFGATKITGSGIYVLKTGDDSFTIRRIISSPVTGKINVTCDNQKYQPEGEIAKDSDIIAGKVIGIFSYV